MSPFPAETLPVRQKTVCKWGGAGDVPAALIRQRSTLPATPDGIEDLVHGQVLLPVRDEAGNLSEVGLVRRRNGGIGSGGHQLFENHAGRRTQEIQMALAVVRRGAVVAGRDHDHPAERASLDDQRLAEAVAQSLHHRRRCGGEANAFEYDKTSARQRNMTAQNLL